MKALRLLVATASLALFAGSAVAHPVTTHALGSLSFAPAHRLSTYDSGGMGTEPRDAVTPNGHHFVATDAGKIYESDDGVSNWHQVGNMSPSGSIDLDLISTRTGRLIGTTLTVVDVSGPLQFRSFWSDDEGAHWTAVNGPTGQAGPFTGTGTFDQDRPWLAVGPDDPTTHLPRVYSLEHNIFSGAVSHEMAVATSTDNGTSFGAYVPVTLPGSQAWLDLQCADSGGPSNLFTDPVNGRVFAVWGSRSSVAGGGCGASATGTFEVNVVAATRVWIASAPASGTTDPTQWTQSLAVDDNSSGKIVGMQLAPGAMDSADNIYILYPESPNPYPDYSGAAIKYVHATEADVVANPYGLLGPANQVWSAPITVAAGGGLGNLLPHIVAGGPGMIDIAYFAGAGSGPGCVITAGAAGDPPHACWYPTVAQTLNALDASPQITTVNLPPPPVAEVAASPFPAYNDRGASDMMGACGLGPANGFACGRSTDVWGVTVDNNGKFLVAWPAVGSGTSGTYVSMQTDGPSILAPAQADVPETPWTLGLVLTAAAVASTALVMRRRRSPTA